MLNFLCRTMRNLVAASKQSFSKPVFQCFGIKHFREVCISYLWLCVFYYVFNHDYVMPFTAGKTTTNDELEDMLESGNLQVFTQDVSWHSVWYKSEDIFCLFRLCFIKNCEFEIVGISRTYNHHLFLGPLLICRISDKFLWSINFEWLLKLCICSWVTQGKLSYWMGRHFACMNAANGRRI